MNGVWCEEVWRQSHTDEPVRSHTPAPTPINRSINVNDDAGNDCGPDLVWTGSGPGQGSVEDAVSSRHVGQAAQTITVRCIVGKRGTQRCFLKY